MVLWTNPKYLAYLSNSSQLKGDPLSLLTFTGIPKAEKILSNLGIADFMEVDLIISISANLEYSSITTKKYSPEGTGPLKSTATCSYGPEGNSVI